MKGLMKSILVLLVAIAFGLSGTTSRAGFLDLTSLTNGPNGSFVGTVDGVAVTGSITTMTSSFAFLPIGTTFDASTINNSSPQYSHSSIYTPSTPLTDRVGYQKLIDPGVARVTINFANAAINPVFQIANLDGALFDFAPTNGIGSLVLLSGNGGGGDGLALSGTTIFDLNPATAVVTAPSDPPPTTGARSSYGSVQLIGTFSSIAFNISSNGGGDSGSFTIFTAVVPEPSSIALSSLSLVGLFLMASKRRKKTS